MQGVESVEVVFRCESVERAGEVSQELLGRLIVEDNCVRIPLYENGAAQIANITAITKLATQEAIGQIDTLLTG